MTPQEQERLFKRLRENYPTRGAKWASGYVHGMCDAETRDTARPVYVLVWRGVMQQWIIFWDNDLNDEEKRYAVGYIAGFAQARNVDEDTIIAEALHNVVESESSKTGCNRPGRGR